MNDKNIKFIFFVLAVLIIGFFFSSDLISIKNFFIELTSPISKSVNNSTNSISGFFSNIYSIKNLIKENNQLVKENEQLNAQIASLSETRHENEILKKEIGFVQTNTQYQLIPAEIIGYSPTSFLQTLKINKGSKDGVEKGRAVLFNGSLVGTISEVGTNYSAVNLITNNKSLIPVVLKNSRGTGLLKGGLAGLVIEDVALDSQVQNNESVVTSGLGGDLPSGLLIGNVEKIISSQSEIFQRAEVKSLVEFEKMELVFVIK